MTDGISCIKKIEQKKGKKKLISIFESKMGAGARSLLCSGATHGS